MTLLMEASGLLERIRSRLAERRAAGRDVPEPQSLAGALPAFEPAAGFPWRRPVQEPRAFPLLALAERPRGKASELLAFDGLAFVINAYRAILARDPEPSGLYRLLAQLEAGWPKAFLAARLRYSSEGRTLGARVEGLRLEFLRALPGAVARHGLRTLAVAAARNGARLFRKAAALGAVPFLRREQPEVPNGGAGPIGSGDGPESDPRILLSICVTTFNRAVWLSHSLPILLEQTRPYQDLIEVVVCDNASSDGTREVVDRFRAHPHLRYHRNARNCGILGNLAVCSQRARGRYVWVIGDDDLLVEGSIERVLAALLRHPESELLYLNYACTEFDQPRTLERSDSVIRAAEPVSAEFRDAPVAEIRRIAAHSDNCFTGIYCLIFRADHARRAYQQTAAAPLFSSLKDCVPTADYVCRHMFDRPGYWVGDPCVVVNRNVSWLRWASLYSLERFPELFELMERQGADPAAIDGLRNKHVAKAMRWLRQIYFGGQRANLPYFSIENLVRRFGHLPAFQRRWSGFRPVYRALYALRLAGRDAPSPRSLERHLKADDRRVRSRTQGNG